MRDLILLVAVLICPVVMGTMMFLMWRGMWRSDVAPRNVRDE